MAKNVQTVEKPAGEILRLAEKATKKEYAIVKSPYSQWVTVRALVGDKWYWNDRRFYKRDDETYRGISIDDKGHPYFLRRYGTVEFRGYGWEFRWVHAKYTQKLNENLIEAHRIITKDKKHSWILQSFNKWHENLKQKKAEIRAAELFEHFGDRDKFTDLELNAAWCRKLDVFCLWYVNRLEKEGYRRRERSSEKEEEKLFKGWVREYTDKLEKVGFRRVKKRVEPY